MERGEESREESIEESIEEDGDLQLSVQLPANIRELHQFLINNFQTTQLFLNIEPDISITELQKPPRVKVSLFKHQVECLVDMVRFETKKVINVNSQFKLWNRMGINSNTDGFGKKLVILALTAITKPRKASHVIREKLKVCGNGLLLSSHKENLPIINATLVLVSPFSLEGWIHEIQDKTELKWTALTSKREVESFTGTANGGAGTDVDVVLVTPSVWNMLCVQTKDEGWARFVFEEPVYTKINRMKWCNADFYWFFTTDPEKMRAQHWNSRENMMQDICGSDTLPNNVEEYSQICIRNNYIGNLEKNNTLNVIHKCSQHLYRLLEGVVNPWVHQIVEASDFSSAAVELTGKSSKESMKTINMVHMVYDHLCKKVEKINERLKSTNNKELSQILLRIEKGELTAQLLRLKERTEKLYTENCPICLDCFEQPVIERHCQHIFCKKCIVACLPKCPMCRSEIDVVNDIAAIVPITLPNDLIHPDELSQLENFNLESYSEFKLRSLVDPTPESRVLEIIKGKLDNGKIIIYSTYKGSFKNVSKILDEESIPYKNLCGQMSTQKKSINLLESGNIKVLLVGNAAETIGSDFSCATDIIFYHNMSQYLQDRLIHNSTSTKRDHKLYVHYLER